MSIPTGYEKLAVIGIAWKNEYVQGTAYKTMNAVYYNGSTYVALRDNPTGPPAADGANWQYLAKGFEQQLLSALISILICHFTFFLFLFHRLLAKSAGLVHVWHVKLLGSWVIEYILEP